MLCFFSLAQLPRHFLSSPSRVCVRACTPDEEVSRQRTPKVKVSACAEDCVQSGRFPPQIWVPRPSLSSSWYTPTSPPSSRQSRPLLIPTLVDGSLRCQLEGLRVSSSSAKPTEATMLPRFPRADVVPPTSDVVPPTSNSKDERRRACGLIARGARSFESNDEYGRVFVHEYSEGQVVVQLDLRVARAARANRLLRPRRRIHS